MAMKREAMHALHELTLSGTEVLCVISGPLKVHGVLLGFLFRREYPGVPCPAWSSSHKFMTAHAHNAAVDPRTAL